MICAALCSVLAGKYAHYAPGLTGKRVRYAGLRGCVSAARTARAPPPPRWLAARGAHSAAIGLARALLRL